MAIRPFLLALAAAAAALAGGCREQASGPLAVSAIGGPPRLANPNLQPLDAPSAFLAEAVAQGLVRFDAAGEIEPALAQSWIVSDDGLRYTFRLRRTTWADGERVTAAQVAARLRAAVSAASRNPLKPVLGAIEEVTAMTDEVLEIALAAPRPYLLQLLAQPEMAILRGERGTGPYRIARAEARGPVFLSLLSADEEGEGETEPNIALRGEPAGLAVARFAAGAADLVVGGTIGDLPIARAAQPPAGALVFDPAVGLFGLAFARETGLAANPAARRALSMAVDRDALVAAMAVRGLAPRTTLVPAGIEELPRPTLPDWAEMAMPMRRELAARTIAEIAGESGPPRLLVAMPPGPGYRLVFAHLRRDWRRIGVDAVAVEPGAAADLRFLDEVAPATLAAWYLRHFECARARPCDSVADEALAAARTARLPGQRQAFLEQADQTLTAAHLFIPIAAPVRWSLSGPRLTGFRANPFARHPAGELIADRP